MDHTEPGTMAKESAKDPVIANVVCFMRGWPPRDKGEALNDGSMEDFMKWQYHCPQPHGCLLYVSRMVILPT